MKFLQITTTVDAKEAADKIAAAMVEQKLAACVQVSGPITSVYRWQGKVETTQEWVATAKTTAELYHKVEDAIRTLHPYDEPEIIATEIATASQGYLDWVAEQVQQT